MNKIFVFVAACCLFACRSKYIDEESRMSTFRILRTEYYNDNQEQPVQIVYPEQEQIVSINVMPYPHESLTTFRIFENDKVIYEAMHELCNGNINWISIPQLNEVSYTFYKFVVDGKKAMLIYKNGDGEYILVDRSNLGELGCDEVDQHVGPNLFLTGDEPILYLEKLESSFLGF
jgi:hypothetical protein